jgi:beta-N-acetylhexosaminidase
MKTAMMRHGPLMVDVAGFELTQAERERLLHADVGGVILFARNFQSRRPLAALCAQIHALRDPPLLIAVDHEGGRVQRFKTDGFTHLPAMRALGLRWMQDQLAATRLASDVGFVLASELRACGVDLSFTPVLDLDFGQSSVIGDRSFGGDARVVTVLAKSLMHGLLMGGMQACGKHFPGHGYVTADSHHAVPVDDRSLSEILAGDAAPYAWLGSALASVMPAHVIYPKVDKHPAGFSSYWLQKVLRKQLGFEGVIFSDDLSMEGASVAGDIHARAKAAINAGCDMVLVCNAPESADALLAKGVPAIDQSSRDRIGRLMPTMPALNWQALQEDVRYVGAKRAIKAAA